MSEQETQDEFIEYDGAYVLGALSRADRDAFEAHLIDCADCQARVAELSDLPGLLALAPASAYAAPQSPADPVVPLLAAARARRRKQRWVVAAAAAAVAAGLVTGTALLATSSSSHPIAIASEAPSATPSPTGSSSAASSSTAGAAMVALVAAPIHATIEVTDVAWGTSIKLHCTYDDADDGYPVRRRSTHSAVRNRAGQTDNLGTWAIVPGKVTTFPAGTAFHKSDIASITVSTASGTPLLQLTY